MMALLPLVLMSQHAHSATPMAGHAGHAAPPAAEAPAGHVDDRPPGDAPSPAAADAHASHAMPAPAAGEAEVGSAPPPPAPTDRAADRVYPAADMAAARAQLVREHGNGRYRLLLADIAEWQLRDGRDGFRWEGEGWYGGDINRLVVKTEGTGTRGRKLEDGEAQALYSRAIDPYWNLQAGVRQDFGRGRSATYAVAAVEGLAPFWFELEGSLFLSDRGDGFARVSGYYDQRITQALVLQPRIEFNLAAQDSPDRLTRDGVTSGEFDLRLRYEFKREFAPYVGISHERLFGGTADAARGAGGSARTTSFVIGIRAWL